MENKPQIIEVDNVATANELMNTGLYRAPDYDKNKGKYIFIPLKRK